VHIILPLSYHIKHIHSLINSSSKAHQLTTSTNIRISHLICYLVQPSTTPTYHLGSISIHATLFHVHKAHISSYAYNSSNSHQSYRSHKLLPNQFNKNNSSFQTIGSTICKG